MASSCQSAVFTWLTGDQTTDFKIGSQRLARHAEALFPADSYRIRVVYQAKHAEASISDWLVSLQQDISLAVIARQSGLHCIEVCCAHRVAAEQLQVFDNDASIELFQMDLKLPLLNEPGLLVMDMDSTAIQIECIDELAAMAGVGKAVAEVTERAMLGELDFEASLRQRVAQLAGADQSIIDTLCHNLPLMPGLEQLVAELKSHGWRIVVASGGFTPFVNHLKLLLDLDAAYANELVIESGKLAGRVTGTVVDAQFKANTINSCAKLWGISQGQRLAIGDGANDIPMINMADYGIAYHAKPKLAQAADIRIFRLNLKALPYLLQLN